MQEIAREVPCLARLSAACRLKSCTRLLASILWVPGLCGHIQLQVLVFLDSKC